MGGFFVALSPLTLPTSTSLPPRSSLSVFSASVPPSTPLTTTCEYYSGTCMGGKNVMLPEIEERMIIAFEKEDADNDCDSNKSG